MNDASGPKVRIAKKCRLLNLRESKFTVNPTMGRTNQFGKNIGGSQLSGSAVIEAFVHFSAPGLLSLKTVGGMPALVAGNYSEVQIRPNGLSGNDTRRDMQYDGRPINATGSCSSQT